MTEDQKFLSTIEECATRSDVVYGFAEVKYKQLIPITPSNDNALGLRKTRATPAEDIDDDLTVDAVVEIAEEALVLYVKTLAILTNTFNLASKWWNTRNRHELPSESPPYSRSLDSDKVVGPSPASVGVRVNNVVQWARNRFNECLEKSEYVTRRLADAQSKLPPSHPGHPSNYSGEVEVATGKAITSTIHLSSGVTAEKLMYDRAVDMSKTAALNELTNEDLPGCEVAYLTAIRLLEAVLENDEEVQVQRGSASRSGKNVVQAVVEEGAASDDIEEADRKTVENRK